MTTLYLLHFDRPISPDHTTQHYVGFATELRPRLELHAKGRGARLTQVALERGIGWRLVRTWPDGSRRFVKNTKRVPDFCPVCNPGNKAGLVFRNLDGSIEWQRPRFRRPRTKFVVPSVTVPEQVAA